MRRPSIFGDDSDAQDGEVPDREILNVFRRSDEKVLRTSEIADELPIGQQWTGTRLERLEGSSRVHSKSAGSKARVWWLNENEVERPVADGLGDLMWYRSLLKEVSDNLYLIAFGVYVAAGILLVPYLLFEIYPSLQTGVISTEAVSFTALLAAVVASVLLIPAGLSHLAVLALDRKTA
jgi:hypothetical protein